MTLSRRAQKTTYKTLKQFSYSSNSFRAIFVLNVQIGPKSNKKNWVLALKWVFDSV